MLMGLIKIIFYSQWFLAILLYYYYNYLFTSVCVCVWVHVCFSINLGQSSLLALFEWVEFSVAYRSRNAFLSPVSPLNTNYNHNNHNWKQLNLAKSLRTQQSSIHLEDYN